MTGIHDIPVEVVARIIELGCNRNDDSAHQRKPSWRPIQRQLKPFAKLAAAVCNEWNEIVHARSGYRFWFCSLVFDGQTFLTTFSRDPNERDIAMQITRLKNQMQSSQNCDIDVHFDISDMGVQLTVEALNAIERLSLHGLLLFIPYAQQIRSMKIRARCLEQVVVIVNALGDMPRLEYFKLSGDRREGRAPDCNTIDVLLSPGYSPASHLLDMSRASNCGIITLKHWDILGRFRVHGYITDLKLTCLRTQGCEWVRWEDIRDILVQTRDVKTLALDMTTVEIRHTMPSIPGKSYGRTVAMPRLREVSLGMNLMTLSTLFSELTAPHLCELDLQLTGGNGPISFNIPMKEILRFPSLRRLGLRTGSDWSNQHDECMDILLSVCPEKVELDFSSQPHPRPLAPTTPRTTKELDLKISSFLSWADELSVWSVEKLTLNVISTLGLRPTYDGRHISMPNMKALRLNGPGGLPGIRFLLCGMDVPNLKSICFSPNHDRETIMAPYLLPPALKFIEHLEINGIYYYSDHRIGPCENYLTAPFAVGEFAKLVTLTIHMYIFPSQVNELIAWINEVDRTGACPHLISIRGRIFLENAPKDPIEWTERQREFQMALSNLRSSRGEQLKVDLRI